MTVDVRHIHARALLATGPRSVGPWYLLMPPWAIRWRLRAEGWRERLRAWSGRPAEPNRRDSLGLVLPRTGDQPVRDAGEAVQVFFLLWARGIAAVSLWMTGIIAGGWAISALFKA